MLLQTSPVKSKIDSVRARLDRIGVEGEIARNTEEFRRRERLYECVFPTAMNQTARQANSRALEGIKDKLQLLSERTESEGDSTAVCDLADDLRDVLVEYQVSKYALLRSQGIRLILSIVLAAELNLQTNLQIDRELRRSRFERISDIDRSSQNAG